MGGLQSFIQRPIMATAINLALLIIGLVGYERLELRHSPNQIKNEFRIDTVYPGVSSYTVEQRITKPLEDALSGLEGIKKISSETADGYSQINVKFKSNINHNRALSELRDRVILSMSSLPENIKRPEVNETTEVNRPILYIAFEDNQRSIAALSDYLRRFIIDRLRLIEGVSEVNFWGNREYEVLAALDPARLMQYQITPQDVVNALKQEKPFASGGEIENNIGKEQVVLQFAVDNIKDYEDVTIKTTSTHRIKVGDVSDVKIIEKPGELTARVDGQNSIGLRVSVKPEANPLKVAEKVKQFVLDLKRNLPPSMHVKVTQDATLAFKDSLVELRHTLWEAILFVGIIITISLASFRAALLPIVTVPLCIIATFSLMWVLGFSLNPITLLALVLAVGLVVDDAIVVVENIHHHMEKGLSAFKAATQAMREITFAIVVMTITLSAVYLPIAFQTDDSAIMFREFACTLAGSVLISGFVALTLTPALCGKYLKSPKNVGLIFWDKIIKRYQHYLIVGLKYPHKIGILALIVALVGMVGFYQLGSELMPIEDENFIEGYIHSENAVPSSLRNEWIVAVEKILNTIPEKERYFTHEWHQRWLSWSMALSPRRERTRDIKEITEDLKEKFKKIVGPMVDVYIGEEGGMSGNEALKVIIQYSGDYNRLIESVKTIQTEALKIPEFQFINSGQAWEIPRLAVNVDKRLAQELGVGMNNLEDTLYTFLSGRKATEFHFQGFDYEVKVRGSPEYRTEQNSINQFFVTGGQGQWIPLGSFVTLKESLGPARLKHYDRMRGASLMVQAKGGVSLDKAMKLIEPIVKQYLPKDAYFKFGGSAEKYREAKNAMQLTYILALLFIYLVLTALFESFIHPLIVLLTVPLSITGSVLAIHAIGGTNNIYTAIGLITLIGLITKHGIMIVDFANRLQISGYSLKEAVIEASCRRLRPILMTTMAMIAGSIPLTFSLGSGAIARHHIGWVIIGGMLTGTFFSLFVIPVAYHWVNNWLKQRSLKWIDNNLLNNQA